MYQCPECGTDNLDGALYCENCGAMFKQDLSTIPLFDESIIRAGVGTTRIEMSSAPDSPHDSFKTPPGSFGLWIVGSNRRQIFDLGQEILIGRLDSANMVFPDLDLTPDGGAEGGISRRHCRITFRNNVPYVEDLNSTNHTYLNDAQLEPLMPYPLQHDDELRLGTIVLRVELP